MEEFKAKYLSFADIANNQIEIEGSLKVSPYRPLFTDTWNKHKELFYGIESFGVYTDEFIHTDVYLTIFYSILYLDYYYYFNKKNDDKKNEKHIYDKKIARLLRNAQELQLYSKHNINLDLPNYPIDELHSLQNYLTDIHGKALAMDVVNAIKSEFGLREVITHKNKSISKKNTQIKETLGAKIAKKNELFKIILSLVSKGETLNNLSAIINEHKTLNEEIKQHETKKKK